HYDLAFKTELDGVDANSVWTGGPCIAKLHGSVDGGGIVPPTWNKSMPRRIAQAWRAASLMLRGATQLRILGYSLPEADAYVKYLLQVGVLEAERLKRIDVVCLDPDGMVEERYRRLIAFSSWRFKNGNVEEYLDKGSAWREGPSPVKLVCHGLEQRH